MKRTATPLIAATFLLAACSTPTEPTTDTTDNTTEEEAKDASVNPDDITIGRYSKGNDGIITATYPVPDNFTHTGIRHALYDGCHQAITTITETIDNWETYGLIQCFGNLDGGSIQVGAANYTGQHLAELNLDSLDPEQLWDQATPGNVNPNYQ